MSTIVVMPGGFHPFHAGHAALYNSARRAFPGAEVFVAATNDTSTRPFPFPVKEKLAKLAGVEPGHFVQVKSPFRADEITAGFNPEQDVLIFVRSEKDANKPPQAGGVKKDGSPAYLQPLEGVDKLEPFARHAYMAYLPTVEFGPGMTSATEIRGAWPHLNEKRKTALVMSLYPATQSNPKLAATVVKLLDTAMGTELAEDFGDEGAMGRIEPYGGIYFYLEDDGDEVFVQAMYKPAADGSTEMGFVTFEKQGKFLVPEELEVETKYQRQGVATTMYDYVKSKGYKIERSIDQTDDGAAFWDKQRPGQKVWEQGVAEARRNPEQNMRSGSGKYDLINYAEAINDKDNWAVSMTMEPKLGINPQAAVSEDTPKGIYFYPLRYFMQMANRNEALPWGDNFPYIQLFQYNRAGEMTQQTQVDPAQLKQALLQYCPEEVIQQAIDEPEYDGTPYWFIYDCLSRLGQSDETNVIRWNKVLRDLGFTSVYDPGRGWIAYNEPTQGVVLDPRIIKQHKMFSNRNPKLEHKRYDIEGLADSIGWSSYYQRELQQNRIRTWDNPAEEQQVRLAVAKSMLKPFLGKSGEEAKAMGYDQALKAAADKVVEILKSDVKESSNKKHSDVDRDPELKQARLYAKQHYPEFSGDEELAYQKWVQRSLQHGKEDDQKQYEILQGLADKIKRLEKIIDVVKKQKSNPPLSEDYIDE